MKSDLNFFCHKQKLKKLRDHAELNLIQDDYEDQNPIGFVPLIMNETRKSLNSQFGQPENEVNSLIQYL